MKDIVTTTTTPIKTDFSYQTSYNMKNGELFISIIKDEQKITLNWWEANILMQKLKLEFCEK
jgi:hypothetical protein